MGGAYAELSLCAEAQVHPLPARVAYAQGAGVNVPYATAYHALFHRGHGDAGETVLVPWSPRRSRWPRRLAPTRQ